MHKDYFEHGHNNILKFFPDRIQIENIWIKPKHFILGKTVFRRNQLIADLFLKIHFGERLGSGMQRMRDSCKKENYPYPEIEFTETHFYIIFRQSTEYLKIAEIEKDTVKDTVKLLQNKEKIIIDIITENPKVTAKILSDRLGINLRNTRKYLDRLKQKGLLKRIGSDKSGHWKIK